jgi:hypothetical protein
MMKRTKEAKAVAKLPDLKQGVLHTIFILKVIDDPPLWVQDDIVSFFEVSLFNFYEEIDAH